MWKSIASPGATRPRGGEALDLAAHVVGGARARPCGRRGASSAARGQVHVPGDDLAVVVEVLRLAAQPGQRALAERVRLPALLRHAVHHPESIYKAYALVRELDKFQGGSRLCVVPFGKAQQSIKSSGAGPAADHRPAAADAQDRPRRSPTASAPPRWSPATRSARSPARRCTNITALDDAVDAADPAPADRLGQDRDHGRGPPHRHPGDLRAARRGLLHAARPPPRRDPAPRSRTCKQIERRLDAEELAVQLAGSLQEYTL